ncbi:stage III sporulation protein AD [Natranaerovirga pectinivora]|uniref:Stage III sporulation protein AD n=1 Tax=Natranaerovirga pectinivora TaxID=682400 RepID=A0A4R3MQ49_9FIRM|nr:stage III sporulation protein AD [Natranaerovirga pectinivora]TCT16914.1 stage III sporulation protein AD [Natranaerovirga pectinivora]
MNIIQISVIGIVAVMLALQFKNRNQEYGVYISLVTAIIIFFFAIDQLDIIVETISRLYNNVSISNIYIDILLKIVGIAYIAEFGSQLCKDAGYSAIASQIEIVGKLSILVISLPILLSIIDTISLFLT